MPRVLYLTLAGMLGLGVGGCTAEPTPIADAALGSDTFVISDVVAHPVAHAYVLCEYSDTEHAVSLGFDREDLYSIDDNPKAWEHETGIGLIHTDATPPTVEWFPRTVDACPGRMQSETEIDPDAEITVSRETVTFDRPVEVAVLDYRPRK